MVKNGEYFMIKEMKEKGMTITAISEHLNRDRKTVCFLQVEIPYFCKKFFPTPVRNFFC